MKRRRVRQRRGDLFNRIVLGGERARDGELALFQSPAPPAQPSDRDKPE